MTHDSRTISAVFMAVVLILASGTAVSLAVTDSSTSDVGTDAAAVQDETTTEEDDVGDETTEEDGVETTEEDGAAAQSASVTFNEQESEGERVVIESVTMDEGGFVAIHDSSVNEAPIASVLGNSVYLEAGTHENVEITLARPIEESQTLVAMPHLDTNDNQVYDFVLSTGELDGPYTADGEVVVDSAEVSLEAEDTTTTEEEEVEETTTTEEEDVVETTTEEDEFEETTTEEDVVEETTTEEEDVVETTTTEEEDVVETTTEEDEFEETTTTEAEDEFEEEPTDEQQVVFKIEQMNVDEWSFVVGDEEEPDRTEVISNVNVQDRRVEINLTEVLQEQQEQVEGQTITTVDPEEAQEQLEENLSDLETVRIVIRNVNVENVTLVVTAPEGMDLPEPPMTTTTEEEDEFEETTTTEEDEVVETTTTEEEDVVEETTTEEEVVETTTEEEVEETTTTEEDVVETTTEEVEEAELDSFNVSGLDAPESASVGDAITVSATVSNPNDQQATQEVAFRLDGTVVERQSVTLDANEQTTVTFEIDTSNVPAGQYIHGVYTQDFGELAVIVLEEPTDGDTGDETTTAAGEDDGETVTVETTTEEEEA